jgi:hypothetical protein
MAKKTKRTPYRIVQPWGKDKVRQATTISRHRTAAAAFRTIDRLADEMLRLNVASDAIELLVVDAADRIVQRSNTH